MIAVAVGATGIAVEARTDVVVGPISGHRYELTYSCPGAAMQSVIRTGSDLPILTELEMLTPTESEGNGALFTTLLGGAFPYPRISQYGIGTGDGRYVRREQRVGGAAMVEVGRGSWSCPDYPTLSRSVFVPIPPERVLDTRPATRRNHTGGKPGPATTLTVPASALPALPAGAVAISVNVTIVQATGPGFAQVLPAGSTPGASSNVNARFAGHTVANAAISRLGAGRAVSVYTSHGAHLLLDVNGYFVTTSGPTRAGRLTTFTPRRVLDTRPATRVGYQGGKPPARARVRVDLAGGSPVPAARAAAAVVNITATQSDAAGFVQAAASGALVPGESSVLNLLGPNETVAGFAIVPVADDGSIELYTQSGAHLVVDVVGWFSNATAASSSSGQFVALAPVRAFDTRLTSPVACCGIVTDATDADQRDDATGRWLPDAELNVALSGLAGVAGSVFANLTAVAADRPGYLQAGPSKQFTQGTSSNVNVTAPGQTVANAAVVPLGTGSWPFDGIGLYTYAGGHIVIDLSGFFTA